MKIIADGALGPQDIRVVRAELVSIAVKPVDRDEIVVGYRFRGGRNLCASSRGGSGARDRVESVSIRASAQSHQWYSGVTSGYTRSLGLRSFSLGGDVPTY